MYDDMLIVETSKYNHNVDYVLSFCTNNHVKSHPIYFRYDIHTKCNDLKDISRFFNSKFVIELRFFFKF